MAEYVVPISPLYFFLLTCTDTLAEAIRYLDYHPEYSTYPGGKTPLSKDPDAPEDEEEVKTRRGFQELLCPLLLNSALAAIKLAGPINLRTAISLANRAVGFALSDADQGRHPQSTRRYRLLTITSAKGLYRRALARIALKEEAEAEDDLVAATKLVDDRAISSELEKVRATRKAKKEREKAKFKKMFA